MTHMANDIADKLAEARKLIERGWTQEYYARGKTGRRVEPTGRAAVCYCAAGAIMRVEKCSLFSFTEAGRYLKRAIGRVDVYDWNDAPERTQAEVIEAFRKAEELARGEA